MGFHPQRIRTFSMVTSLIEENEDWRSS
ncbi:unnamed protein product [Callosobruchus maculatus]|uniref:Uncharacterized protein n=1 Tax=Callosobruchus maculatus TaxID=64391 RepID=A0A653D1D4_CALMS|nr:unnamed protein product [Callosobruchus maculatus]